jgi:hypothetical protein
MNLNLATYVTIEHNRDVTMNRDKKYISQKFILSSI